jgi:hypothetical protein
LEACKPGNGETLLLLFCLVIQLSVKEEEDQTRNAETAREREKEEFMDELEEDPEFRSTVNLIAVPNAEEILAQSRVKKMATGKKRRGKKKAFVSKNKKKGSDIEDDDDDGEDDFPTVELSELISQAEALKLN